MQKCKYKSKNNKIQKYFLKYVGNNTKNIELEDNFLNIKTSNFF